MYQNLMKYENNCGMFWKVVLELKFNKDNFMKIMKRKIK